MIYFLIIDNNFLSITNRSNWESFIYINIYRVCKNPIRTIFIFCAI
nr:MAG TPA: hypothetical protein [Caudoviricetes sp.]